MDSAGGAGGVCRSCDRPAVRLRRGQCSRCYLRSLDGRKAAGIFYGGQPTADPLTRLLSKVTPGPRASAALLGGCWLYTGPWFARGGAGQFSLDGKNTRAHRSAYALTVGALRPGQHVRHLCGRIGCVNPAHLDAGDGRSADERAAAVRRAIAAVPL